MKNTMKYLLLLLTLSASNFALAQDKTISRSYACNDIGCALTCLNFKNNWSTVSDKANKVTINHYANGNIEFLLDYQNREKGNDAIFISEQRLSCKLSGIESH